MLLAPLVGIILNLLDASGEKSCRDHSDVVSVFASADCSNTVHHGFRFLLQYNWVSNFASLTAVSVIPQN